MNVNTSVTGALVLLVIVVFIVGMFTGLALAGTDLFNPNTSSARANQMNLASEYQAQKDAIDLEFYRLQKQQEAELQRRQMEQELAHQRELQILALKWYEIRQGVLLPAVVVALVLTSAGLAFYLASLGYRNLRQQPEPRPSPELRKRMRALARANELLQRQIERDRWEPLDQPVIGGNGHH